MTMDQGIDACKSCIKELNTRFMIKQHGFIAKIVTREGIKEMTLTE